MHVWGAEVLGSVPGITICFIKINNEYSFGQKDSLSVRTPAFLCTAYPWASMPHECGSDNRRRSSGVSSFELKGVYICEIAHAWSPSSAKEIIKYIYLEINYPKRWGKN